MSKAKAPLLSLGASGTLARTLTFRRTHRQNIALEVPTHPDARSLPQLYHRWIYQDACFYWQTLSAAQHAAWAVLARGTRRTGFNLFLADYIATRPDIDCHYRLGRVAAAITPDISVNTRDGTVFGAALVPGLWGDCLSFDGLDDRVVMGTNSVLNITGDFSLVLYFKSHLVAADKLLWEKYDVTQDRGWEIFIKNDGVLVFGARTGIGAFQGISSDLRYDDDSWHLGIVRRSGATWYLNVDRTAKSIVRSAGHMTNTVAMDMGYSRAPSALWYKGLLDEATKFNRFISDLHCQAILERRASLL